MLNYNTTLLYYRSFGAVVKYEVIPARTSAWSPDTSTDPDRPTAPLRSASVRISASCEECCSQASGEDGTNNIVKTYSSGEEKECN